MHDVCAACVRGIARRLLVADSAGVRLLANVHVDLHRRKVVVALRDEKVAVIKQEVAGCDVPECVAVLVRRCHRVGIVVHSYPSDDILA